MACKKKNKFKFIALDFSYLFKKDVFKGRVSIIQKKENIIDIIFQLAGKWHNKIPKKTTLIFPFLRNLNNHKSFSQKESRNHT